MVNLHLFCDIFINKCSLEHKKQFPSKYKIIMDYDLQVSIEYLVVINRGTVCSSTVPHQCCLRRIFS